MDEGDDSYVPQMSQMGEYNPYSGAPPMQQQFPQGMPNPYAAQNYMQQQAPPPQTQPVKGKGRSKKKDAQQPQIDPMQSMQAMSHNPMLRPSQPFAPQGYPGYQQQYYPPHMYPSHDQMAAQQHQRVACAGYQGGAPAGTGYPPPGMPATGYPPPYYSQQMRYPPNVPPPQQMHYGYAPTEYPPYDQAQRHPTGHPPVSHPQQVHPAPGHPAPHPSAAHASAHPPGHPPQSHPQNQSNNQQTPAEQQQQAGWNRPPQQMPNPYMHSQNMNPQQMELMHCQQHLQRLYAQQRTPQIEEEIARFEQRVGLLEQSMYAMTQQRFAPQMTGHHVPPHSQPMPNQPPMSLGGQERVMPMDSRPGHPPVSVTQSSNQIQVNIKPPEQSGHTLISVYHQYGEQTQPPPAFPGQETNEAGRDCVPPEPIPSAKECQPPMAPYSVPQQQQPQPQPHPQPPRPPIQSPPQHNHLQQNHLQNQQHIISPPPQHIAEEHKELPPPPSIPTPPALTSQQNEIPIKEEEKQPEEEPAKEEEPAPTNTIPSPQQEEEEKEEAFMEMKEEESEEKEVEEDEKMEEEEVAKEEEKDEDKDEEKEEDKEESPLDEQSIDDDTEKNNDDSVTETATDVTQDWTQDGSANMTPIPVVEDVEEKVSKQKSKKKTSTAKKGKKRKKSEESDDDNDDDFVVEKKKKKKREPSGDLFPAEMYEKRRSGRAKQSTQRFAEQGQEGRDMDVIRALDEEDALLHLPIPSTSAVEAPSNVVEKILNLRETDGKVELYVKYRGRAYAHCEWKTLEDLESEDKRVTAKYKRYKMKRTPSMEDEEEFNPDFLLVERVLDVAEDEDGEQVALVKWRSLAYDEATWEKVASIPADKIEIWRERQVIDKAKAKEKGRPAGPEWRKIPETLEWKDGNTLREYQFEGVNWLLYCYYHKQNCILADEMGLGKTVQTIAFLSQVYKYGIHGPFLIVVPLSTVHNWMREFDAWTSMNVVVYHGSAASRQILQQYEFFYNEQDSANDKLYRKNLIKLDAIITTFEMVVTDVEILKKINFRICVIDEAHRLKNRNCKLLTGGLSSFKMEHRVLLTGTPLQNNIEELFSLLNFLSPLQFASPQAFLEQFGTCQTDEQVTKLQEILKPMMLRRLKEDVEKTLQPKQETIIEVQLSDTQKKYYRAILERNFSHLCKGASAPALMNVMMELRKCCNHPFLIQGAEDQILSETRLLHPEWSEEQLTFRSLVESSGKLVLIEKLLPKLKKDGHKVLIFSQMVKVLDLIEEFLVQMKYSFERIDGNIRGDLRQMSIDRFSRKDSDRFVFLLCTRAGGLGINLTAADTCIIFDSDWNPQNDLQAQARCHRIGQTRTVKIYRLITANTYEREMFDKASLKLGLDKAVLQSTHALRDTSTALSRKEVEELLKKGAYGSIMDEDNEGSKFSEEDIDTILQRRTTTITVESGLKGSTFSKASFNSSSNREDIDIDDPNFWSKWAKKANVDADKALTGDKEELIVMEPRQRKKRFEQQELLKQEEEDSDSDSDGGKRKRGNANLRDRKRKKGDEDSDYVTYRPDELAFNKSEFFKVEKQLASWGWGRWAEMREGGEMEVSDLDMLHMARTLVLHCLRDFRGDDRTKDFIWKLISPPGTKSSKLGLRNSQLHEGWAALPEYNPPAFALDNSFQRHVHRHANKLLAKIEQLHHLETVLLADVLEAVKAGKAHGQITFKCPSVVDPLCPGWDADCDKNLLIGVYRHGLENVENVKTDEKLCFAGKEELIANWPAPADLQMRFRRIVGVSQRNLNDPTYEKMRWSRRDEQEYMRVLRSFGMKDKEGEPATIDWGAFRKFSPALDKKTDDELQEQLYCILAMCTRVQGGELSPLDTKRALSVDSLSPRRAQKLMNRLHLTRKIHALVGAGLDQVSTMLKLCSSEAMPSGWTSAHDRELLVACHECGIDGISSSILNRAIFQKIIRPSEKILLRRVMEICMTIETGKWNGTASIDSIEDSDSEERRRIETLNTINRSTSSRGRKSRADTDKDKMRALLHQSFLQRLPDEVPLALMMQSMLLQSVASNPAASAAMLLALSGGALSGSSPSTSAPSSTSVEDALNLSKKEQAAMAVSMNELYALASLPPDTRIPVVNSRTGEKLLGESSPQLKNLLQWLNTHPEYTLDVNGTKEERKPTPAPAPAPVATPTPAPAASTSKATASSSSASSSVPSTSKLEPGEIPKKASSASDPCVPVCNRSSGSLLPSSQWPHLSTLGKWLDSHPEANVHANGLNLAMSVIMSTHPDRLSVPPTPSTSDPKHTLEQLQMQMLLQQSMMNPLLGLGMTGLLPQASTSKQDEAVQQQMLLSLLASPLMVDPTLLAQLSAPQAPAVAAKKTTTTPSTSSSKLSSKLQAVVEKLASSSQP